MSIARHHAEWLSLLETSGPFLSMPVLLEAFPQGLDAHDAEHHRVLRFGHGEWEDNRHQPATHAAWVRYVLARSLDYSAEVLAGGQAVPQTLQAEVPEHRELLRPDFVLHHPGDPNRPRLLIQTYPHTQDLSRPVPGLPWKASPDTRMAHLLHATGVRLGLVTNGERWMLVNAPRGETTGFASWYATLWLEEPLTFRAFRSLLGVQRFFGVKDEDTPEQLLARSAANQQEVTDQLGYQVRRAVEVLIQSLDRADQDRGRELLRGVGEAELYEAALTVMMRLVFLFCAEERELLLLGDPIYDQHLAVSTIREQLQQTASQYGEEILERRHDAWCRLLVAFRAVHGGVWHDDLKLPAYGGRLFDPDRFPFLEGRKPGTSWREVDAEPLPVNNRTVLHLLESLQTLETKLPGDREIVRRRLSFRSLDIEQIGHVYEGLLDHTARRATEPHLGLAGTKDKEPEVSLAELEARKLKGEKDLLSYLKEATGKSEPALKKLLAAQLDAQHTSRFRAACQGDDGLWQRVQPFAGLVRMDSFGYPVVIPTGSVYVTEGTDRRSSGTHYTPRSLTEPIVQYTLEPLVYAGPAEGLPRSEWKLKPAKELLDLKVCDMACGSGAFLVQACRYLAERLQEAWQQEEGRTEGQPRVAPEGLPSAGRVAERVLEDDRARQIEALRLVAQRCLYGVDKNPLAVEMAKLSLWLLTLAKDRPFEFLDHAVRCGDSLVGIRDLKQLERFNLDGEGMSNSLFLDFLRNRIPEAVELRRRIEAAAADTVAQVEEQERMLAEAEDKLERLKLAADLLVAAELVPGNASTRRTARNEAGIAVAFHFHSADLLAFRNEAKTALAGQPTFHWPLEFPEVMADRGGFDAFVCNPPFINAIDGDTTEEMKTWLRCRYKHLTGTADLSFYFLARIHEANRPQGTAGLILPRAFLNAPAAKKLRGLLLGTRPPAMIYCPDGVKLFHAANVRVAALAFGARQVCCGGEEFPLRELTLRSDNWWEAFAAPSVAGNGTEQTLGRLFEIMASMTTGMAYELLPFVVDEAEGTNLRFVTTGLIDPNASLWGRVKCKYLKRTFDTPRITIKDDMPSAVRKRLTLIRRPKVLIAGVAGPGNRVEAFVDREGCYCGAVSTFTVFDRENNLSRLDTLCAILNGDTTARLVAEQLGATAMGSGLLTITKAFLQALPLHEGGQS